MLQTETKPKHYQKVIRADRWARRLITFGGYGIIASIVAILLFLAYQSLPLAKNAAIKTLFTFPASQGPSKALLTGIDPFQEIFYILDEAGHVQFYQTAGTKPLSEAQLPLSGNEKILAAAKGSLSSELFAAGTDSGRIITAEVRFQLDYSESGRAVIPSLSVKEIWKIPAAGKAASSNAASSDTLPDHVEKLAFSQNEDGSRFYAWVDHQGALWVRSYDAEEEVDYLHPLSQYLGESSVTALTISNHGENLVAAAANGIMRWFDLKDLEKAALRDEWSISNGPASALSYLLGDQAVAIGTAAGAVEVWFPVRTPSNLMKFRQIHSFRSHSAAVAQIYHSSRNRDFLTIDAEGAAQLHYSTTGKTEVQFPRPEFSIAAGAFAPKSDGILLVDAQKRFTLFRLDNPHPESTVKALFGKVWYEGYPGPEFVWQSTGGSDEFESKLSLIPLIFGTLKGTLYALLFSVPIALLAAIYVSQFAPFRLSRIVKPTVEIMAALPSVVIGFLAGLYFSPLFEQYLMSTFVFLILLPLIFLAGVAAWRAVPESYRMKIRPGFEVLFIIPVILIALQASASLGHPVENFLFRGNFQQWLYTTWGITYETRNSFVVGFALGFAVIPIIFTVSEDALSNVPKSLTSASLALGASRWQTVRRVVIPAASGGIFAAIMLGLGRAVGETMIVLMATGNTPIIDFNPFNGFRAMSACIAVEIPEAPVGGTLYRVLFLTALLLFVFTFVLNTLSSLVGERLRKKYARF
ncbi:MAG: ABC transporter permease subunit [Calditrichaceae bacterium]|nr:ABC transporter permease subunit [Calditrichia bacterium]NUQ40201.1 ABC transporter permease subunit [Calditrichaceae bacterium]